MAQTSAYDSWDSLRLSSVLLLSGTRYSFIIVLVLGGTRCSSLFLIVGILSSSTSWGGFEFWSLRYLGGIRSFSSFLLNLIIVYSSKRYPVLDCHAFTHCFIAGSFERGSLTVGLWLLVLSDDGVRIRRISRVGLYIAGTRSLAVFLWFSDRLGSEGMEPHVQHSSYSCCFCCCHQLKT